MTKKRTSRKAIKNFTDSVDSMGIDSAGFDSADFDSAGLGFEMYHYKFDSQTINASLSDF